MVSEMNVNTEQLTTIGLGYKNDFHIDDIKADGSLDESVATLNRSVIFVFADSDVGKNYI